MRSFYVTATLAFLSASQAWGLGGGTSYKNLSPAQVISSVYQPWSGPMLDVQKSLRNGANYVIWIHVPAQHPLDLRSAENFRKWFNATPLTQLTISHNMVAFRCRNEQGQIVTGATGMTGSSNRQDAKAILAGFGLSVFFSTFTDGHLNPQKEVDEYVTKNLRKRGAVFTAFEVTDDQCKSMQDYLVGFIRAPGRPYENFSSVQDPEKMEGGGCVTFASALMKKAGQLESVIPHFYRNIGAAKYLLGGNLRKVQDVIPPVLPWLNGKRYSVSILKFINANWTYSPPDSKYPGTAYLRQMDPEKMGYALQQFSKVYLETISDPAKRAEEARKIAESPLKLRVVTGLGKDYSKPDWPYVEYKSPINDSFDPEMAQIGREARAWLKGRLDAGYSIRMGQAVGMPVLVIERP